MKGYKSDTAMKGYKGDTAMKGYKGDAAMKGKSSKAASKGGLAEGLVKKEGFNPSDSSPPETNKGGRPKHDNSMISRKVHTPKA